MASRFLLRGAAAFGFAGVALGAFGAHGLKDLFAVNGMLAVWQTAVFYHITHSIASLWAAGHSPLAAKLWMFGILLFSGSLYILAVSNIRWIGAITPVGGLLLLAGWVVVLIKGDVAE